MKKILLATGGVALVGTTATAIALPLYVKSKAEQAISNFVSQDGPSNDLSSKTGKIKYIALGDSLTSGYNGFMGRDFVSYADFIAADLKKAGRLSEYRNFATTGDEVWDSYDNTILSPSNTHAMQDADLITVTLGSNDLMVAIRLLRANLKILVPGGSGFVPNSLRTFIDENANKGVTFEETLQLIDQSLEQLENGIRNKNFAGFISLIPEYEQTIFDLIKRNLLILDRDLHKVAPNAKIVLLSPFLPFQNLPDSVINGAVKENGNKSIGDFYKKYIQVFSDVAGYNNFTNHIAMKDLPTFKKNIDDKAHYIDSYGMKVPRALPNVADIHPSTYGHELLGNDLFDIFGKELGIKNLESYHSHGRKANTDDIYEIYDEKTKLFSPEYYDESDNEGVDRNLAEMVKGFLDLENGKHGLQSFVADNVEKVIDLFLGGTSNTMYKYDSTYKGKNAPLTEATNGRAQEIPEVGESIGNIVQGGENKSINSIINSLVNLVGMMTDAEFNKLTSAISENFVPYMPTKLKVKEGGTTKEIDYSNFDANNQEVIGITAVDHKKRWTLSSYNNNCYIYYHALAASINEQHKLGNDNISSTTTCIPGHGDVPDFNFKELGFKNLGNYMLIKNLNKQIGMLFIVPTQIPDGYDTTNASFLHNFGAIDMFKGIFDGDYDAVIKSARINPNIDLDKLTNALKLLADKGKKEWSWINGFMADYVKEAKAKNDDDFNLSQYIQALAGKSADELKTYSKDTQEAFRQENGNYVHLEILVNRIMNSFHPKWSTQKDLTDKEIIQSAWEFLTPDLKIFLNDKTQTQFKPITDLFSQLLKGSKRLSDFLL